MHHLSLLNLPMTPHRAKAITALNGAMLIAHDRLFQRRRAELLSISRGAAQFARHAP